MPRENLTSGFPNRSSNTGLNNHRRKKEARNRISEMKGLFYLCSKNKGTDQLRGCGVANLRLCSHMKAGFLMTWIILDNSTSWGTLAITISQANEHPLPGQVIISHICIFVASPIQALPSEDGVGLVHVRCLCDRPGPHVLLQDDQLDHVLHPPLTVCQENIQ